ncbi:MAG: DUF418 domain-containing protein [Propionibacteriaceae bacterium]|nr:DUF418 domain-containing protein [Propionibacteriaceae bacterium]
MRSHQGSAQDSTQLSRRGAGRLLWPDLARGIAVISMLFAHTAPAGGVLLIVEFLTAPLFATLVGVSLWLDWHHRGAATRGWVLAQLLRGLTLIVLGELAQPLYAQIVIVLQTLGFLTIALAPLVALLARRPWISLGLAAATTVVSPLIMSASRTWLMAGPPNPVVRWLVNQVAASPYYRLSTFLAFGFLGLALTMWVQPVNQRPRRMLLAALATTAAMVACFAYGVVLTRTLKPYSGTHIEIVSNLFLVAATLLWCVWATAAWPASVIRFLEPLIATGRMALTAYLGQVVLLAYLTTRITGGRDDSWFVLGTATIVLVAFCWAWQRWQMPPLFEGLLRWQRVVESPRATGRTPDPAA